MESRFSLDVSTTAPGYLADAIAGWSNQFKLQQTWVDLQHLDDQVNQFLDITSMDNFLSEDYGVKKMAYPFDMVKRGGIEGHATLEDINYLLRMPPTRPIRHPVGDFAATTPCISAGGFGMSGKAVVALTKIHTQGRGTITVIRTRS